jgi:chaperonin cofactor prefoldin
MEYVDAPTPVMKPVVQKKEEPKSLINDSKLYELNFGSNLYSLLVEIYSDEKIKFNLRERNKLSLFYYIKDYQYKEILDILGLNKNRYENISKIFEFCDDSLKNKNVYLKYQKEDKIMILKFKIKINSDEFECDIKLDEKKLDNDDALKILFDEINILKGNNNMINNSFNYINNNINNIYNNINELNNNIYQKNNNQKSEEKNYAKIIQNLEEKNSNYEKRIQDLEMKLINMGNELKEYKNIIDNKVNQNNIMNFQNNKQLNHFMNILEQSMGPHGLGPFNNFNINNFKNNSFNNNNFNNNNINNNNFNNNRINPLNFSMNNNFGNINNMKSNCNLNLDTIEITFMNYNPKIPRIILKCDKNEKLWNIFEKYKVKACLTGNNIKFFYNNNCLNGNLTVSQAGINKDYHIFVCE